ncbi:MAG: BamA/TamA family outer membrane protein [Luteitalea sp.]
MRRVAAILLGALVGCAGPAAAYSQAAPVIEQLRVHGNHSTPDDEVLRLAGLSIGSAVDAATIEAAQGRLRASGRFSSAEIRQRSRSLDDDSGVALIILVAEHAALRPPSAGEPLPRVPGVLGRLGQQTMFLPILRVEDGYGVTYGARVSLIGGRQSLTRVSVPASWGGTRQLAIEGERTFATGRLTRLRGSAGLWRQEHPFYDLGQVRRHLDLEVAQRPHHVVGYGATASLATVSFGAVDDRMTTAGLFAEVDTRGDPLFPRNAVFARSQWRRLSFARPEQSGIVGQNRSQWQHDVRGYVGLIGQAVFSARMQVESATGSLPAYAQPILGGADTLRGFRAGTAVGDNLLAASLEVRVPVSSPLRATRLGVLAFQDVGTVWNHGQRWRDQDLARGLGAGVFLVNPFVQAQLSVARGLGRGTRVHLATGVSF